MLEGEITAMNNRAYCICLAICVISGKPRSLTSTDGYTGKSVAKSNDME